MSRVNGASRMPPAVRKLLGKPPLMIGEDPADYDELLHLVLADVRPSQLQEWLLVKDIVDAEWELLRLRGLKPAMLHAALPCAFQEQLTNVDDVINPTLMPTIRRHVIGILAGNPAAKQELAKLLEQQSLNLDLLTAAAFQRNIVPQLQADRMAGAAYARRNAAYAELERLRSRKRGSAAARDVMDEDLQQVEPDALTNAEAPPTAPLGNGGQSRA
jgi:hypothetical protein